MSGLAIVSTFFLSQRVARSEGDAALGFSEPGGEDRDAEDCEQDAGGNPHDQAGQLLILDRIQAPGRGARAVDRIPQMRRECNERAERAAVSRRGEDVDDRRAVAEAAVE